MRPTPARRITGIAIALARTLGAGSFNNGDVNGDTFDAFEGPYAGALDAFLRSHGR